MGLELTGERTLPGVAHENYWFRRHEAAYRFAAVRAAGLAVLDDGCGEGYGAALLAAAGARAVTGVDLDARVAAHAAARYPGAGFAAADCCRLPLAAGAFDAVVSLQVVEHLWDIPAYLGEVARVLAPGGWFLCGTPNRLTFTPEGAPANPFHTVELTAGELAELLAPRFARVELHGLHHGPRLAAVERERGRPLPGLLLATEPERWPGWLAALVRSVEADDFVIAPAASDEPGPGVDASLDLLALAWSPV